MTALGFINLGTGELFVIFLVALIIFGPNKLPEIARNIGKTIRSFQAEGQKAAAVLRSAVEDEQPKTKTGVIDRPDTASSRDDASSSASLAEPAPEGTERHGVPDGPAEQHAPTEPPMDPDARLLEDT